MKTYLMTKCFLHLRFSLARNHNHFPWCIAIPLLALITLLTSCATVGNKFNLSKVEQLIIGTTTMEEVRSLFGNPFVEIIAATWDYRRMHFGDESTAVIWRYAYGSGTLVSSQAKSLQVEFELHGIVIDYYFSSDFKEDETRETKETTDFDIFSARTRIIPGKTTQLEVIGLLGSNYRKILIRKPGTRERWHYSFIRQSKDEKIYAGSFQIMKIYGKSLDIDFDGSGVVVNIKGESDFPVDKKTYFKQ